MKTFAHLPTEILHLTCTDLPPATFLSLSITSRRLHQFATPRVYESVYFWGTVNKDKMKRVFNSGRDEDPPLDAIRVYDLDALIVSLQKSYLLGSHFKKVELTWGLGKGMDEEDAEYHRKSYEDYARDHDGSEQKPAAQKVTEDGQRVLRFIEIIKGFPLQPLVLSPPGLYFQVSTSRCRITRTLRLSDSDTRVIMAMAIQTSLQTLTSFTNNAAFHHLMRCTLMAGSFGATQFNTLTIDSFKAKTRSGQGHRLSQS